VPIATQEPVRRLGCATDLNRLPFSPARQEAQQFKAFGAVGPAPRAAAVAVGLAMVAMHLSGTFHLPAGIDPLVVVVNNMPWSFLIVPVGIGALLLATFAFAWHNLVTRRVGEGGTWPIRWW
jgi:hypothetical protein